MNVIGRTITLVSGAILLVLGFMFSLVLVAVVAVAGLVLGGWFLWKTRHLRKAMREAQVMRPPPTNGDVIEGEAVVVEDYRVSERPVLPDESRKPPA